MQTNIALILLILGAALSRMIPHPPNATAVVAMGIFAGAYFNSRLLAVFVPLAALFISDLLIGFHSGMIWVYGAVAVITVFASWFMSNNKNVGRIVGTSFLASCFFFLTTNFAVWLQSGMYTRDLNGFLQCYTMAIPFFGNQLMGDFFFSAVLFGAYALSRRFMPATLTR